VLFTSTIWLLGLVPWLAVAFVLLLSRRPPSHVPFLDLWTLDAPQESIRRSFSTPPAGVLLALLATLLAILAAAGPAVRRPGAGTLVVVMDAGRSMSAATGSATGPYRTRFAESAERLGRLLREEGAAQLPIELRIVPDPPGRRDQQRLRTNADKLPSAAAAAPPSALNTQPALDLAVRQALAATDAGVVVLTDQRLAQDLGDHQRIGRCTPLAPHADNLGIVHLAVRRSPTPQAMVRVANTAAAAVEASLQITTAGRAVRRPISLAPGQTAALFVPLPAVGDVVTAELSDPAGGPCADGFPGDDRADVVAETDAPIIQPEVPVAELQRLADVYAAARPPGERSVALRLTTSAAALGESPGIILAALSAAPGGITSVLRTADHPATAGIDLSQVPLPATSNRSLPPGDWQPLLSDSPGPLLAVRQVTNPTGEGGTRQAWCAIDPRGWADRVEYVLFWSALLDWLGGIDSEGADRMFAWPLESLRPDFAPVARAPVARGLGGSAAVYWPGVYERQGDARRRAFGPAATTGDLDVRSSEAQLDGLRRLLRQGERQASLSPWLLLAAIASAVAAAAVWRRSRRAVSVAVAVSPAGPAADG